MSSFCVDYSDAKFSSVYQAFEELRIQEMSGNPNSILIWTDSLNNVSFDNIQPYQVINRIPNMEILSLKASFFFNINRMKKVFPNIFSYFPRTFILPIDEKEFTKACKNSLIPIIIKPDNGSFGNGIKIHYPGTPISIPHYICVAQDYIPSYLIDNTKFDFRIYVLVTSVNPLTAYVYREGIARFCSKENNLNSKFAQLTNIKLNMENKCTEVSKISRLISEVMEIIAKTGAKISDLWEQIDDAIALSLLSGYPDLVKGVQRVFGEDSSCLLKKNEIYHYPRCFQILGFDILLDENLHPWVLEMNYRPSLKYYQRKERDMKVNLIKDSLKIAAPLEVPQAIVMAKKFGWEEDEWNNFLSANPDILKNMKIKSENSLNESNFVQILPMIVKGKNRYEPLETQILTLPKINFRNRISLYIKKYYKDEGFKEDPKSYKYC